MDTIGTVHMLRTNQLIPNPDNPRKDLGDIEELEKSIRKNGIMQNLTVVPADDDMNEFMVLIGHRRLAAAKAAGLCKVPCVIAEGLTREEQLAIMLEENMQRNDLTVLEQAESFQMMIDLGNTIESLTEKTGFSESTIRHRLKIAELDCKVLSEKQKTLQLSLTDLYELEKVKDVKVRNKIVSAASSAEDLRRAVDRRLQEEREKKTLKNAVQLLYKYRLKEAPEGTHHWDSGYETFYSDSLMNPEFLPMMEKKLKKLDPEKKYVFLNSFGRIYVLEKVSRKKRELTKEEQEQKEWAKRRKAFVEIQKAYDRRRHDFILNELQGSKLTEEQKQEIMTRAIEILLRYGQGTPITAAATAAYVEEIDRWKVTDEQKEAALNMEPWVVMLAAADYDMGLDTGMYRTLMNCDGKLKAEMSEGIMEIYSLLTKYGYEMEPEEKAMLDGTHELYGKEKS